MALKITWKTILLNTKLVVDFYKNSKDLITVYHNSDGKVSSLGLDELNKVIYSLNGFFRMTNFTALCMELSNRSGEFFFWEV